MYKYAFKKGELTNETSQFKLGVEDCMALFIKKVVMEVFINLINEKVNNMEVLNLLLGLRKKISLVLGRWADDKVQE